MPSFPDRPEERASQAPPADAPPADAPPADGLAREPDAAPLVAPPLTPDPPAREPMPTTGKAVIDRLASAAGERFKAGHMIKSFDEFLDELFQNPRRHTRNAAQYMHDMIEWFGSREVRGVGGKVTRWNVFESPSTGGKGRVFGQERSQNEFVKYVRAFAEKGKVDKLLMLHGPNGSSKSTTVECIMKGLEQYSREPEGAQYRFNWVFTDMADKSSLGFGPAPLPIAGGFAHAEAGEHVGHIPCELRDNPIFLIPLDERAEVLRAAFRSKGLDPDGVPAFALESDLCQKCREIHDTLHNAYRGDWKRVMEHVQVERYFISKRYRVGAVAIEPQVNVDASARGVAFEKGMHVPPSLQSTILIEPNGALVDANRGIVEYSDFFKRPLETNKYLLTTVEKNTITLPSCMAYTDLVMTATSNEKQLCLFKRDPDFASFKGRFELIKVPYLLEFSKEERIYDEQLGAIRREKHVSPHVGFVAALWAVLTRLKRPRTKNYPGSLGNLVGKLTPVQKAVLYDRGRAPEDLSDQERRELVSNIDKISSEFDDAEEEFEGLLDAGYEGRRGASPREMQTLLADAAAYRELPCLSPLGIFRALRELVKDVSVFDFLRLTPQSGYCDNPRFIDDVEAEWRRIVEEETQDAMDLVSEKEYQRLFDDYFANVRAYTRSERVRNRQTGDLEAPDEDLMAQVERAVEIKEKVPDFRKGLVTRIGAWSIEHPGEKVDLRVLFGDLVRALKADVYKKREKQIEQSLRDILKFRTDDWSTVGPVQQRAAKQALARLRARYGYCLLCAKETVAYVLKQRLK